jgi:hypothetical protein
MPFKHYYMGSNPIVLNLFLFFYISKYYLPAECGAPRAKDLFKVLNIIYFYLVLLIYDIL